jgi:hypothetical protein
MILEENTARGRDYKAANLRIVRPILDNVICFNN